jgi:hypothetical protein
MESLALALEKPSLWILGLRHAEYYLVVFLNRKPMFDGCVVD